jgi:transcriptional regulator with XRE-family HTH domain
MAVRAHIDFMSEVRSPGLPAPLSAIDKEAMGRRIKEIRKAAGMRQWQLAQILGTTQSAVHKYERGVIPESRRLIELAQLGRTSIEWILTGRHWENGSEDRGRIDEDTFNLALALRNYNDEDRRTVEEAMRILGEAALQIVRSTGKEPSALTPAELAVEFRGYHEETRRVLAAALAIHGSVLKAVFDLQEGRLAGRVPGSTDRDERTLPA